jgi:PiT family inorganic phosphate transporter
MLFLIYISSGLFLGWSLGANDAANVFGTAVGSKMVSFKKAALIASIFVILGAVFQGRGGAETLNSLGKVDALAGGFTVSLCAAFIVFIMTKKGLPVSTTQAVVGAIMGWSFFTGHQADYSVLATIVSTWIISPILGMLFASLLFLLVRYILYRSKIHVIKLDSYIRISLIIVGGFGAYSLGANNIANVMGVFTSVAPEVILDFGITQLDGTQLLFLLGGIAIAIGIYTYGKKVMDTVGDGILSLTPEAAIVVVLAQGLVLFVFSSTGLSNFFVSLGLPPIPLVPVSSSQVVVGSVLGIGIVKGVREIRIKTLGNIALGWITTPVLSGFLTYFLLFFMQNVFRMEVTSSKITQQLNNQNAVITENTFSTINLVLPTLLIISITIIVGLTYYALNQKKIKLNSEKELVAQQNEYFASQKKLNKLEVLSVQAENNLLNAKLEAKRKEFINIALNLTEQRQFLEQVIEQIDSIKSSVESKVTESQLRNLSNLLRQRMTFSTEKEAFYVQVEQIHKDFRMKLDTNFKELSDLDKKLAILIRLNLSTKEMATLLGISPKSVEVSRYRLKKKLGLGKDDNLIHFINNL